MKVYNTISQSRIRNVFYDRFHSHIRFQITMVQTTHLSFVQIAIVSRTIEFIGTVEISVFHENPSIFRG